jgi:hypothetical protein
MIWLAGRDAKFMVHGNLLLVAYSRSLGGLQREMRGAFYMIASSVMINGREKEMYQLAPADWSARQEESDLRLTTHTGNMITEWISF